MSYKSSIIFKYGDTDKVHEDVKVLKEIIGRQGASLLIDVIANFTGEVANKFKLSTNSRAVLLEKLTEELKEALCERL